MSKQQLVGQLIALKGALAAKAAEVGPRPDLAAATGAVRAASQLLSAGADLRAAESSINNGWAALERV